MKFRRSQHRTDSVHKPLCAFLAARGATILDLSGVGGGCPDIAASKAGRTALCEFKSKGGKLNEKQQAFAATWQGRLFVVEDEADCQGVLNYLEGSEEIG